MADFKTCFVICPFGKPESSERARSDELLERVIIPAVSQFGYKVKRADLAAEPGVVTIRVIQHLIEDDLVVADITDRNPNVYYELAIRHAIRKPFVQLLESGQEIPFNIQGIQTVPYSLDNVDDIMRTVDSIRKQILFYESTESVTSPVSVAIDALIGTASMTQFEAIMEKLVALDSGVESAAEFREELVREVKKGVVEEIEYQFDNKVAPEIEAIHNLVRNSQPETPELEQQYATETPYPVEATSSVSQQRFEKASEITQWIEDDGKGKLKIVARKKKAQKPKARIRKAR